MLRSNCKKAIENIKNYIMENYDGSNYDPESMEANATTFEEIATCILKDVRRVKGPEVARLRGRYSWQQAFIDWAAGLPGLLDTCYYYNRYAGDDLAAILQETEEEKARFSESQSEEMLSRLIYRELVKAAGDVLFY